MLELMANDELCSLIGIKPEVLPNQSGLETQHENLPCGDPATTCSSRTNCNQVIIDEKNTKTWTSFSLNSLECVLDADKSAVVISSMSMATGASQHSHYPINKASVNHSSNMFSSQGGPNRGWTSEGKTDLSVGTRGQSNWGTSNINLNPSANPAAWPILGHEGPGVGTRPGGMGGSGSVPSNVCGPGGVAPIQGTNGNGNLVGDCAWGNPDTPEQHQSPTSMNFSMEPPNLKTDGLNTKAEPMSPVDGWGRNMSQSPTEPATGDGTARWGIGEMKSGESKDSGWDSGGISSWGTGGDDTNWGHWNKQSSTEGTGWDANDGPTQESMNSWGTDAPGSEGSKDSSEGREGGRETSSSMDVPLLPRQDLDPRVLCNSGWGQTPVRQHTVWEMDENHPKDEGGTDAWGASSNAPSTGSPPHAGCANPNQNVSPRMESGSKTEGLSRVVSTPRWGGSSSPTNQASTGWGEPPANKKVSNGSVGSWGEPVPDGPSTSGPNSQFWGSEDKSSNWDDGPTQVRTQPGGNGPSSSSGWGNCASGDWGEPSEGKVEGSRSSSWDGDGGSWKENQKSWGKAASPAGENWRDSQRPNGWGGKNPQDSVGSWGGPNSVKQSGSSWRSTGRQDPGDESTGWEEPSPSSIRRKMEIDDGTATWGDPNSYRTSVNMWDRNKPSSQGNQATISNGGNTAPNHHGHGQTPNQSDGNNSGSPNQLVPPQNRMQKMNPGWGELPNIQPKPESWGDPDSSNPKVDNGTAAWGKSPKAGLWGENGHESSGSFSRGSGTSKPVPKSMQDTWGSGGEESGISSSQWDAEDGDMWTSPTSQDNTSSCSSWNQPKKGVQKVKIPTKQDEVWIMNRLIKQLTDMGFPRDPAEEALRSNNMNLDQAMSALLEKKSDGEKRGIRTLLCRPPNLPKDLSLDRNAFLDKDGGLSDDTPTSPFVHSPGPKLTNSSLPSHGMGGVSPGLMQNLNSRQNQMNGMFGSNGAAQSRAPPPQALNSAHHPPLRAQVPQFLSPQVQAQLLQFAAKNIGLNPALLTSPINPQQMTLLYQLQQLQMAYQRLQIQQQMMQAQRNASGPIRQQEQQVARTISNMQQQIQQHQRQLAQALLMKQQQQQQQQQQQHQASSSHSYSSLGKSNLDAFPGNSQASTGLSMSDLHTKEPHTSPSSSYGPYPLSGLNGSVGVGCMDTLKDTPPQPQSRLSQWTHTSSIDSISTTTSSSAPSSSHAANIKPVLEDSFSAYSLMSSCQSPSSPLGAPESWPPGKNTNDKMANGTNVNWPPEFCPGVPWKGLQNIDPESDPNVTPGSVSGCPTINTNIQDVNRYLLRDRNGGKLLDMKSTWSTGSVSHTQPSLSNEMWKIPVGGRSSGTVPRPPPGLTNNKHNNWTPGALSNSWSRDYASESTGWNSESTSRTSSWLVLRNLTPQIDGSTLRTLCMQHGPLITFHLSLPQGNALVRYSSKEEAAKAQKSLHMCVLGNTTILAEFAGEEEVTRFFSQAQSFPPSGSSSHSALGQWGASTTKGGGNSGGGANGAGAELLWGGVQQPYSSLWGPINGEESRVMGSPVPVNTLLPGDLLSGENM